MSNKWVNPQPKLVPQPYTNLLTERDIGKPPILETRHLGIDFGGLTAVADFNLAIGRTEITGLIGPNGAGKTTIFNVITGSIVYNAGIDASTALLTEDVLPQLLLQVVVKKENADTDWAKAIVDAYHSDEFKQYMNENNDGLWYIPDELK